MNNGLWSIADSNRSKRGIPTLTFFLIYNQLVTKFNTHFMLGRFGQILGCFFRPKIGCKGTTFF